jgi:hypothetical protein
MEKMNKLTVANAIKTILGVDHFTVRKWVDNEWAVYSITKQSPAHILGAEIERIEMTSSCGKVKATLWVD